MILTKGKGLSLLFNLCQKSEEKIAKVTKQQMLEYISCLFRFETKIWFLFNLRHSIWRHKWCGRNIIKYKYNVFLHGFSALFHITKGFCSSMMPTIDNLNNSPSLGHKHNHIGRSPQAIISVLFFTVPPLLLQSHFILWAEENVTFHLGHVPSSHSSSVKKVIINH